MTVYMIHCIPHNLKLQGLLEENTLTAENAIRPPNRRTTRVQETKVTGINLSGRGRKVEKRRDMEALEFC